MHNNYPNSGLQCVRSFVISTIQHTTNILSPLTSRVIFFRPSNPISTSYPCASADTISRTNIDFMSLFRMHKWEKSCKSYKWKDIFEKILSISFNIFFEVLSDVNSNENVIVFWDILLNYKKDEACYHLQHIKWFFRPGICIPRNILLLFFKYSLNKF